MVGTFNGNPIAMAAIKSTLTIMNEESYNHISRLSSLLKQKCEEIIKKYNVPAHVQTIGAKGCLSFVPNPIVHYRNFKENSRWELTDLLWYYLFNNGVYMTPGGDDEFTLSIQHTEKDIDSFVRAFEKMILDIIKD